MTLPITPLWAFAAARHRPPNRGNGHTPFGATDLAAAVGVSVRAVHRWRAEGLSWAVADRVAVALGTHACLIWGDDFWSDAGEVAV